MKVEDLVKLLASFQPETEIAWGFITREAYEQREGKVSDDEWGWVSRENFAQQIEESISMIVYHQTRAVTEQGE
jgi:hypothetical protein